MNRTWFTRMLLSYVPAFFILSAFLFFIFFKMLSDSNADAARKSNEFVANQARMAVDSSLKEIDRKITLEMLRNRTILQYFTEPTVSDLTLQVSVMNELAEMKIANPLIHSIYMVRADRTVLNMSTMYSLDRYPDAPFIESILRSPNSKWSDVRIYRELNSERGTPVVTLTRSVSIFSGKYGLIVVNVNAAALQALVRDMYDPAVTGLRLYDGQGNDLFAVSDDSPTLEPRAVPGHRETMASESVSDYTGWRMVSVLANARMISWLISTFDVWFVLGLVACGGALCWIVWMTRQNYRPIRNLVAQLRSYSADEKPESKSSFDGEFRFINSALEHMIHQNNRFQLQLQEDLKVKRNFFLYELLEGMRQVTLEEWAREAGHHGWPQAFGRARIVVLEIDGSVAWRRTFTPSEQDEWKRAVEAIVARRTEASGRHHVWQLWTGSHQLAVMLMGPGDAADADMLAVIRDWHACIRTDIPFDITIGLGEPIEHPDNIRDAYEEALESLQYKAVEGGGGILFYKPANAGSDSVFGHLKRIEAIADQLRLSDGKWRVGLRALFRQMELDRSSRDEIEHAMNYLVFMLGKAIDGMGEDYRKLWFEEWLPVLHRTLSEAELLSEISHSFFETLERFEESKERLRDARSQGALIKEVKAYIENNYANPALSLDLLSEKFGISGKYLSRLFKEEFGLKFVDFLIDLRVRQARKLLSETNVPIQDIAERLGYSSPISFARTFKKIVGMPPGDYRKDTQA